MVKAPPPFTPPNPMDVRESARYLRPQPRHEVPRRQQAAVQTDPPGQIAHQLLGHLGHRVIRRET